MKRSFSDKRGFSLLELVVAIALLSVVILTVCSVFTQGLQAIKKGQKNATALHIANKKISELNNLDLTNKDGISYLNLCANIENYDPNSITPSETDFVAWPWTAAAKTIYGTEEIADNPFKFMITVEPYNNTEDNLKKVTIKITWVDAVQNTERNIEVKTLLAKKVYN